MAMAMVTNRTRMGLLASLGHAHLRPRASSSSPFPPTSVAAAAHASPNGAAQSKSREVSPLPTSLRPESLPTHVAIIMDGNSRRAKSRGLTVFAGHEAGLDTLDEIIKLSCQWGIRVLTVFAFSTENWSRPQTEVDHVMMLFEIFLRRNIENFMKNAVRARIIGDFSRLPNSLQKLRQEFTDMTSDNGKLDFIVAFSYSGRMDITQACKRIAKKVKQQLLEPEDINESIISRELLMSCSEYPDPDLLIRTSGETMISNFLLWQLAYTEIFFSKTYWPDFSETDYAEALRFFQSRQRRYGLRTA